MFIRVLIFGAVLLLANTSQAQTPTASPSLEQRVADLEAYVNNSARGSDSANAKLLPTFPVPVLGTTAG